MASFEKVVVIPEELEKDFKAFLASKQKGGGIKEPRKKEQKCLKGGVKKVEKPIEKPKSKFEWLKP